jgi:hypothetical protein
MGLNWILSAHSVLNYKLLWTLPSTNGRIYALFIYCSVSFIGMLYSCKHAGLLSVRIFNILFKKNSGLETGSEFSTSYCGVLFLFSMVWSERWFILEEFLEHHCLNCIVVNGLKFAKQSEQPFLRSNKYHAWINMKIFSTALTLSV